MVNKVPHLHARGAGYEVLTMKREAAHKALQEKQINKKIRWLNIEIPALRLLVGASVITGVGSALFLQDSPIFAALVCGPGLVFLGGGFEHVRAMSVRESLYKQRNSIR